MALTERQIMDKVYEEAERIHSEIKKSERTIDRLCEEQSGTFRLHARGLFTRSVKGTKSKTKKAETSEPTPLRATGGQSA